LNHRRYLGTQGVIITHLEFVNDDTIILIDDGNCTTMKQYRQGLMGILIATFIYKIILCQQDLRGDDLAHEEVGCIFLQQKSLTNCSRSLFIRNLGRTFFKTQSSKSSGNCPR